MENYGAQSLTCHAYITVKFKSHKSSKILLFTVFFMQFEQNYALAGPSSYIAVTVNAFFEESICNIILHSEIHSLTSLK